MYEMHRGTVARAVLLTLLPLAAAEACVCILVLGVFNLFLSALSLFSLVLLRYYGCNHQRTFIRPPPPSPLYTHLVDFVIVQSMSQ